MATRPRADEDASVQEADSAASEDPTPRIKFRPQFRKEERREFRYWLSIAIAVFFSWAFWLIPGPVRGWFADRCGDMFYRSSKTYPDNVGSNVETVMLHAGTNQDREIIVRSVFRNSARNFMDLITMPRQSNKAFLNSVRLVSGSWATLDEAIAAGKGGILFTGHVGCFDFIGQAISARGYKLTVVTGRTTSRFIFDGVTYLRGARGATMVEPTPSGVRSVVKALRRNEFAVFVTDRDFFQNGMDATFMGVDTTLPPGAIRIARETGAPLISIFTRRVKSGHELRIGQPFHVRKTDDMQADLAEGMKSLVAELESGISASLDQWAMFQRVWSDVDRVPIRVFPVGSPLESELLERVASALPERETRPAKREHQSSVTSTDDVKS
ncbi:MAG: lipid A biosynthesis acyltransferase [Chloroflexia bacterium]|nr:lipid A biosynthesis acyltransferase [Chloroflexia bacterium]